MGILAEFFGFQGRLDRLGYAWRSMVMIMCLVALAFAGVMAANTALKPRDLGDYYGVVQGVVSTAIVLASWSGFALTSRRVRDMGFEPVYIVPPYFALWIANVFVLAPISRTALGRFGGPELAWVALQWLTLLPLLCWPPARRDEARRPDSGVWGSPVDWRQGGA